MAIYKRTTNIDSINRQRRINIKFPLKIGGEDVFEINKDTISAVIDDLKILLLTNHHERPGNNFYGANLRPLLFEQETDDTKQKIADAIVAAVEQWMPYVFIQDIEIFSNNDDPSVLLNELRTRIKFRVGQTPMEGDVSVTLRTR